MNLRIAVLIPVCQRNILPLFQIAQIQNRTVLDIRKGFLHGTSSDIGYFPDSSRSYQSVINPALFCRKLYISLFLFGICILKKDSFHSHSFHKGILHSDSVGCRRQIHFIGKHISKGQRFLTGIQINISTACHQRIQTVLIVRRICKHILYIQKCGGQRRCPVKAVKYLTVAHPQFPVHIHHIGIHGRGKDTRRRISCQCAVIFRSAGKLFQPVQPILPFLCQVIQRPIILLSRKICRTACIGNTGIPGVDAAFRQHRCCGNNGNPPPDILSLSCTHQIKKRSVKHHKNKRQKLYSRLKIIRINIFFAIQNKHARQYHTVYNLCRLFLPHLKVCLVCHD